MSFHEVAVTIRAVNRASHEFARVGADAETMAARVQRVGSTFAGLGAASMAVAGVGRQFGILSDEQSRWLSSMGSVITALGMFLRTSIGVAVAEKVYTIATTVAAKVTWVFNAALAMKIALLTLGVGLVVATAAYMAWLASTTREAASAIQDYNAALSETPIYTRSVRRAGEEEELRRRGIE